MKKNVCSAIFHGHIDLDEPYDADSCLNATYGFESINDEIAFGSYIGKYNPKYGNDTYACSFIINKASKGVDKVNCVNIYPTLETKPKS